MAVLFFVLSSSSSTSSSSSSSSFLSFLVPFLLTFVVSHAPNNAVFKRTVKQRKKMGIFCQYHQSSWIQLSIYWSELHLFVINGRSVCHYVIISEGNTAQIIYFSFKNFPPPPSEFDHDLFANNFAKLTRCKSRHNNDDNNYKIAIYPQNPFDNI